MISSDSSTLLIVRLPQESSLMLVHSAGGLSIGLLLRDVHRMSCIDIGLLILFLNDVQGQRICLIIIPPKSYRLQRIVMENRVTIITQVCTRIIWSSLSTSPSLWALAIHAMPL